MNADEPLSELDVIFTQARQEPLVDTFTDVSSRFGGNLGLLAKVLTRFVPEVESQMHNLFQGLADVKGADIKSALHTLKGVTSTVGAQRMSFVFAQLEQGVKEGRQSLVDELFSEDTRARLQGLIDESNAALGALYAENGVVTL